MDVRSSATWKINLRLTPVYGKEAVMSFEKLSEIIFFSLPSLGGVCFYGKCSLTYIVRSIGELSTNSS
jgi:hypothetical protein